MSNQIKTQIDVTLTGRNRLTALFRVALVLPIYIFFLSFSVTLDSIDYQTGITMAGGMLLLPPLLALLFRQVYPSYALVLNKALLSLSTRINAYLLVLSDDYPSIEENSVVTITFPEIEGGRALNRYLPLVKWFLAAPLYIVGIIYAIYAAFLTMLAWFSVIFTGNYPEWCAAGVVGTIAYWNRVMGYAIILVTDEYPSFSL